MDQVKKDFSHLQRPMAENRAFSLVLENKYRRYLSKSNSYVASLLEASIVKSQIRVIDSQTIGNLRRCCKMFCKKTFSEFDLC